MKFCLVRPSVVAVLLAVVCLLGVDAAALAQTAVQLSGQVRDAAGRAVAGASVFAEGSRGEVRAVADNDGRFLLDYPDVAAGVTLHATARAMESDAVPVGASAALGAIALVLHPSAVAQQITVTATRSSMDMPATANTVYALSAEELNRYPAFQLDDKLRQQAGFELFRRSSSRVQNPTSQGISLRGLGSTAVSRTLVLEDSVPMNDPFGGWIHWDEIPAEAIEAVTIATGGGSDLYGSSALGGVVDVIPAHPSTANFEADATGGGQDTSLVGVRGDVGNARVSQLLAGDWYRTAGYIPTAPSVAGPVDTPANVHSENARSETDYKFGSSNRVFLVGNLLNEARGNGTRLTNNGTRLWRYIGGDDWNAGSKASGRVRLFGSDEAYRQSFSSVNTTGPVRTIETLTSLQHVRTQEEGASTDASLSLSPVALVVGVDVRDIRGTDNEQKISAGVQSGLTDTSARQRFIGGFGEALASHKGWSAALSLRLDSASNLDTRAITLLSTTPVPTANRNEFIPSPRFGIVRQLPGNVALHASVFRAFRTPTMNELYRTGQVGAQVTQANPQLQSERATGWEAGATYASPNSAVELSGTYFWTEINRPVSAVLLSTNLYRRENLGQIQSQGTELHLAIRPRRAISASFGYQYAHAVVTQFSATPQLVGKWIPEVPRQSFTAQLRAQRARIGEVTLAFRATGQVWDDSANTFLLNGFFQMDLSAQHDFGSHWTASTSMQNLLNQRPEVARTPLLTLGTPFLAQGGIAFHWNRGSGR